MIHDPQNITILDPRSFAGTPFEVAGRAIRQVAGLAMLAQQQRDAADRMARNAFMETNLITDGEPDAPGWEDAPQKKLLDAAMDDLGDIVRRLDILARSVEFDPKDA